LQVSLGRNDFRIARVVCVGQANHDHVAWAWGFRITNNKHPANAILMQAEK
jgi:hypothetical protein